MELSHSVVNRYNLNNIKVKDTNDILDSTSTFRRRNLLDLSLVVTYHLS